MMSLGRALSPLLRWLKVTAVAGLVTVVVCGRMLVQAAQPDKYRAVASSQPARRFALVNKVTFEEGGFFAGAAARNLELIAIGGYVSTEPEIHANERHLTFFDADGNVLSRVNIGHASWAVAMTPDGARTIAGSDDENLYIFQGTTLTASGRPVPGNGQIRGAAISDDGRYAAAGGFKVTVHDLAATDPITPIFVGSTTDQLRAVDFSADGRYVAYGGRFGGSNMYLGVYDLQTRTCVYTDTIAYSSGTNAELRSLAISPDGNRIVAGNWAGFVHYYVRTNGQGTWSRVQSIGIGNRVYCIDMDATGTLAVVGMQETGLRLYQLGDSAMSLLWERPAPGQPLQPGMDGGQRYVSITGDGQLITAGTRGGGNGGGQIFVFNREGNIVFSQRSDAVRADGTYVGPNGADPEVWFARIAEDGRRIVFASWGGEAYFFGELAMLYLPFVSDAHSLTSAR